MIRVIKQTQIHVRVWRFRTVQLSKQGTNIWKGVRWDVREKMFVTVDAGAEDRSPQLQL